ncbi:ankyrin-3-like [Ruditapes philippinarum]|uniref:ankyrin-3-like n=1 Tax=Ruditapes philippinarum TaxID=129788 RepID=UPI00295B0B91|nr:ankyrin-3-like [Ruditapes philippinarum]
MRVHVCIIRHLFAKDIEFFSSPLEFFQKFIQDISKDEDEFIPLVLVWLKTPEKLAINNFNIGDNRKQLQKLEEEFGYPFHKKAKEIKKCLDSHRDEFLVFSTKTGEYSFSHSVISDVVGIVCAREYADTIIKHASKDFVMKYVKTTLPCFKDDLIIYIEEYQFNGLIEKFNQLLHMAEDDTQDFPFDNDFFIKPRVKYGGIGNTRICSHFLMNNSVLKHDAFYNKDFIKKFVENWVKGEKDKRVNNSLVYAFEILKIKTCIKVERHEMGMCLPSILLAKKNELLVQECLNKSVLNENEKYISLLLATRDRNKGLVQKLVLHGMGANEDVLQIATVNEDLELLDFLLQNQNGYDFPSHIQHGNSPLITAAKRGSVDLAECLLRSGVDVNYRNKNNVSALDKAVIWNQVEMCRVLLNHGAAVNVKGGKFQRTPLNIAADMGRNDLVQLLLNNGADVNKRDHKNDYPCQSAAVLGHSKILKEIIEKDISSGACMSLYHIAVVKDNQSILRVLKEVGVDPNMKDKYGRTALYLAAVYGKTALVQLLLDVADPNVFEKNGYTPLNAAVYKDDLEIVQLLSNRQQVIVNLPDKRGYTPLHLACKTANYDIIVELLKMRQVDVRMMTKKGETVLHILKASTRRTKNLSKCLEAIQQTDPYFVEQSGIGISFDNYENEN